MMTSRIFSLIVVLSIIVAALVFVAAIWLLQAAVRGGEYALSHLGVISSPNGGWALFSLILLPLAFLGGLVLVMGMGIKLVEVLLQKIPLEVRGEERRHHRERSSQERTPQE